MADSGFQRAHDRHGTDAKQNAGGDKALREAFHDTAAGFSAQELCLDCVTGVFNSVINAHQFSQHGSKHHADDHAEQILGGNGTGNADQHGAEPQGFHYRISQALFQPVAKENPDQTSGQHRKRIDKNRGHLYLTPVCM